MMTGGANTGGVGMTGGASAGGEAGTTGTGEASGPIRPCDIYESANTPGVAARATVRAH